MRHFLAENAALLERLRSIESSQAAFQRSTDEHFDQVFRLLEEEVEKPQRIFFAGQMFDAFSLLADLVDRAEREIVLVDGYVDVRILNILAKKREGVAVTVYTSGNRLTQDDVDVFNAQYPPLTVLHTRAFHDRFLILDGKTAYHIGASLKDAGKKCFGIDLIQDRGLTETLVERLGLLDECPTSQPLYYDIPCRSKCRSKARGRWSCGTGAAALNEAARCARATLSVAPLLPYSLGGFGDPRGKPARLLQEGLRALIVGVPALRTAPREDIA